MIALDADCVIKQCGIHLYQLATGMDGKKLGNGMTIDSNPANMQKELKETWYKIRGKEGDQCRQNIANIREVIKMSSASGLAKKNMIGFNRYFTAKA